MTPWDHRTIFGSSGCYAPLLCGVPIKVQRRIIALAGLLRRARVPLTWQEMQRDLAPLGDYKGNHTAVRKQVQRDIKRLQEIGLVVDYDQTSGGYRLNEQSRTARRMELTGSEASLLRQAAGLVTLDGASPFAPDLYATLETLEAFDIEAVDRVLVHETGRDGDDVQERAGVLAMAAWRKRRATFSYKSERGGPRRKRDVEPWGLYSRRGRWYLVGQCRQQQQQRSFRLSLMKSLRVTDLLSAGPQYEVPADFDLQREANLPAWDWEVHAPVQVVLRVSGGLAPLVARQLRTTANSDRIRLQVTNSDAIWNILLDWMPRVTVEAPPDLRQEVEDWYADITKRHGGSDGAVS